MDEEVDRLYQAYGLFRQLVFEQTVDSTGQRSLGQEFSTFIQSWRELQAPLRLLNAPAELNEDPPEEFADQLRHVTDAVAWLKEQGANLETTNVEAVEQQLTEMAEVASVQRPSLNDVDTSIAVIGATLEAAVAQWTANRQLVDQLASTAESSDDPKLRMARGLVAGLHGTLSELVTYVARMRAAIYDNGETLRVVPALNAQALEKDRDTIDSSQPWLDLQTLLFGSDVALAAYPQAELQTVRERFAQVRQLYAERGQRPRDFSGSLEAFASALRNLSERIEPLRRDLPIKSRDDALLAYTAYPVVGGTDIEVRYNRVDPFMWAWVIYLAAAVSVALAFGVARKPMFWVGMLVLVFALLWSVYGFALRIAITKWAPVTNMYETVVYVPFVVATLGTWFTLLPATWPGIRNSWRLTGIIGSWEQPELNDHQRAVLSPSIWKAGSLILLVPRAGLTWLTFSMLAVWPYAAGGRTIINRLPNVDVGATLPDFNDGVTWLVGLCVLIPAVWYLPRVVLTAVISPIMVPLSAYKSETALLPKVYERRAIAGSAAFVAFLGTCLAWYSPLLDGNFSPLMPVLRDNFWLTIHVLTIVSSYGAGALAWGLGVVALGYYVFGRYRDPIPPRAVEEGFQPAHAKSPSTAQPLATELATTVPPTNGAKRAPEACSSLARYIYSTMQVAVLLLAAGTILGGLWADVSWGRFWGWDPKEVWALISLLTYLAILHARFAGWVGNFGLALGTVFGATSIGMSWYGVNFVLGAGLHAYGFGSGGLEYVGGFMLLNWIFAGVASVRYWILCQPFASKESDETPAESEEAPTIAREPA